MVDKGVFIKSKRNPEPLTFEDFKAFVLSQLETQEMKDYLADDYYAIKMSLEDDDLLPRTFMKNSMEWDVETIQFVDDFEVKHPIELEQVLNGDGSLNQKKAEVILSKRQIQEQRENIIGFFEQNINRFELKPGIDDLTDPLTKLYFNGYYINWFRLDERSSPLDKVRKAINKIEWINDSKPGDLTFEILKNELGYDSNQVYPRNAELILSRHQAQEQVDQESIEEKALEVSQGQEKNAEGTIGDFPGYQEAAPLPEVRQSQGIGDFFRRIQRQAKDFIANFTTKKEEEIMIDFHKDSDLDGLTDRVEMALGTNPLHADSDGDGKLDYQEVIDGENPRQRESELTLDEVIEGAKQEVMQNQQVTHAPSLERDEL